MKKSQIGAILYTLRDLLTDKTYPEMAKVFKKLQTIGFETIQVSGIGSYDPKELKKILDDAGLSSCASHETLDELKENPKAIAEKLSILACNHTACPYVGEEYRSYEGYQRLSQELNTCAEALNEFNITLSYHNHAFEFEKYQGTTGMDLIIEHTNPDLVKIELDTYWAQYGGVNPMDYLKKLAGRIPLVHLKDMAIINNAHHFAEIGQGNLNWHAIIPTCEEIGVEWFIIEQDTCRRPPLESVRMSFEFLNSHFAN